MFSLFVVLLRFSISLATKFLFLNDGTCMVRPVIIDMNPVELRYCPFIISLNKCAGNCNVWSQKICVPTEIKDKNVKAFSMTTKQHEIKSVKEHISCDSKYKFNSTTCN